MELKPQNQSSEDFNRHNQIATRMIWLDSMRAIAAFLVIFQHYFYDRYFINTGNADYLTSPYEVFRAINFGKLGVIVFFFISGFIIPSSFFKRQSKHPIKAFMIARFFRLYPVYWFSVVLVAILQHQLFTKLFFFNLTMVQQLLGSQNLLGVYWTLQIEIIFYVLCALMFYLGWLNRPNKIIKMVYVFIVLSLLLAAFRYLLHRVLPVALPLSLCVMLIGTLFYWHTIKPDNISAKKLDQTIILFILCLIPICFLAYQFDTGLSERWYGYFNTYCLAICLFFALATKLKIEIRILTYLGIISYSIYLIHPLCAINFIPINSIFYSLNALFSIGFTILVATIIHYLMEKPSQRLGKIIITKWLNTPRISNTPLEKQACY